MKLIYTDQNLAYISHLKSYLESNGIHITIKNEYLAGGVGELPATSWPELWVINDNDFSTAKDLLEKIIVADQQDLDDWKCSNCNETNEGQFAVCWNCAADCPE